LFAETPLEHRRSSHACLVLGSFSHQSCRGIFERFRLCACEAMLRRSSRTRHGHCIPLMAVAPPNRATATGPSAVEPMGETPFFNALGRATETTVRARASIWPQEHTTAEYHVCVVLVRSGTNASVPAAAGPAAPPASTGRRPPPPHWPDGGHVRLPLRANRGVAARFCARVHPDGCASRVCVGRRRHFERQGAGGAFYAGGRPARAGSVLSTHTCHARNTNCSRATHVFKLRT